MKDFDEIKVSSRKIQKYPSLPIQFSLVEIQALKLLLFNIVSRGEGVDATELMRNFSLMCQDFWQAL